MGARRVAIIAIDDACRYAVTTWGSTAKDCAKGREFCESIIAEEAAAKLGDGIAADALLNRRPDRRK